VRQAHRQVSDSTVAEAVVAFSWGDALRKIKRRPTSQWRKKARKGFRGYPVATVAFYGPDNTRASKVAVGIILGEGEEPAFFERWHSDNEDVRHIESVESAVAEFIMAHDVMSVLITDGLLGCPHEEGIDYAEGESCPECPYWAGRDRFSGERIQ
jgi:hypothetical protein